MPMGANRITQHFARSLMVLSFALALPACQTAGGPAPLVRTPEEGATARRWSLRPILDGEGSRPFFLAGYAGANYGPGLFSRRVPVGTPVAQPAAGPPSVTVEKGTWEPE
jgi:hypothetical protein